MEPWVAGRVQSAMLYPLGPARVVAVGCAGAVLPRGGRGVPRGGAGTAQVRLPGGAVWLAAPLVGERPVAQCAEGVVLPQRARRLPRGVRHGEVRSVTTGGAGHRHEPAQMVPTHSGSAIRRCGFCRPHRRPRRDPHLALHSIQRQWSPSPRRPKRHPGQPTGRRRGVLVRARVRGMGGVGTSASLDASARTVESCAGRGCSLSSACGGVLCQCPGAVPGWAAPPTTCTATG
mmetsp:Transcript_72506/g.204985  ORF Transcript_72506/g.204985 Transcript_72506/m.204985 type:complete len:232 (+) Transcript_72506:216-911(+)